MADKNIEQLETKIKEYEEIIASLQDDLSAETEKTMRALADLQNYQRRENENKSRWSELAIADFLRSNLSHFLVLQKGAQQSSDKDLAKAVDTFFSELKKSGVEAIEPKKGDDMDPALHEVVMTAEGDAPGTVIETFESGWRYGDHVIQPAKVSATPIS